MYMLHVISVYMYNYYIMYTRSYVHYNVVYMFPVMNALFNCFNFISIYTTL